LNWPSRSEPYSEIREDSEPYLLRKEDGPTDPFALWASSLVICVRVCGSAGAHHETPPPTMKEKREEEGRLCRLEAYFLFLLSVIDHALIVECDDWFVSDNPPIVSWRNQGDFPGLDVSLCTIIHGHM